MSEKHILFRPRILQQVGCPADRGNAAYSGQVRGVSDKTEFNYQGQAFVWVTVKHPRGTKHVWPSNRLENLAPW